MNILCCYTLRCAYLDELVINSVLHKEAGASGAVLASVEEDAERDVVGGWTSGTDQSQFRLPCLHPRSYVDGAREGGLVLLLTLIQIRRLEDNLRGLAAQFQGDLSQGEFELRKKPKHRPINGVHTFLRLLLAAASMILRPVAVLPVKAILSTSLWADSAAPPTEPRDGTVLTTPGGNLAR